MGLPPWRTVKGKGSESLEFGGGGFPKEAAFMYPTTSSGSISVSTGLEGVL